MQVAKCTECQTPLINVNDQGYVYQLNEQPYAQVDEAFKYHRKPKPQPLFHIDDRVKEPCPDCAGKGKIANPETPEEEIDCSACAGSGSISVGHPRTCPNCGKVNRII